MKVKFILIFFFGVCHIGIISSQYIPIVEENKFWIYHNYNNYDKPNIESGYLINFEGDTVINNTYYKKVWRQELSGKHHCDISNRPCFSFDRPYKVILKTLMGFIREDIIARRVYYKPRIGTYCNEEEYILFNFSLNVNDELDDCKKEALGSRVGIGIIDSISNIPIFDTIRNAFHTTGVLSFIGLRSYGQVRLIEGIGFERHGLFRKFDDLSELFDYCKGTLSECNIITQISDLKENEQISFYPNPSKNMIFVTDKIQIASLKICNPLGQKTNLSSQGNRIELSGISPGMYILEVSTIKGKTYMLKLIKE